MGKINIGAYIAARRKERGLTQEALADYLGVSKPAVSKWESGQTCPDITLLPLLASFFNTSIDDLIGYEAQMTKADIRTLYKRLSAAFAAEPFEKVCEECRAYVKKYRSCWNLLYSLSLLLINHSMLAGSPEKSISVLQEAASVLEQVEKESGDPKLAKEALSLRAYCCLAQSDPACAINLLDDVEEQQLSPEILLAKAHAMRGETGRAAGILQFFVYRGGINIFSAVPDLMALYGADPVKLDSFLNLALAVGASFEIRKTMPHLYFTLYLSAAALYASVQNKARALDMLEAYTDIVTDSAIYPLKLRGSALFDKLEQYYDTVTLGNTAPRSEILIKKDLKDAVINNPAFFSLVQDARYQRLVSRLEHFE